jgi:hypothetical protein
VKLLPWPKFGPHPPLLKIEGGTVEIFDPLSAPASTFVLREVDLTLTPPPPLGAPTPEGQVRRLQGTLVSDHFRQLVIDGQIDPYRWQWSIDGSVELLDLSPELRAALPQPLAARLDLLRVLRGATIRRRRRPTPSRSPVG